MFNIKELYSKYLSKVNFNCIAIITFIVIAFIDSDSSFYKRSEYDMTIRSLEKEIRQCKDEIETNRAKLEKLRTNKEGIERFAREEYLMKKPNEDIFIIKQ
ncbi:MAG: septum formation initiator family protein [Tannerellaceae bacterium]|nr:septum formation initiator family protein [Tannerellaceae bacterium]